jgi:ATP-binding cassette subfamily C protein CydCD
VAVSRPSGSGKTTLAMVGRQPADGLDTPVGEHRARLSGGQRERLALALALLADFPVVILDEPAERLNDETADALTADLLAARPPEQFLSGACAGTGHKVRIASH